MLGITEAAGAYLSQVLSSRDASRASCIRLVLIGSILRLEIDKAKRGDIKYSHNGKVVLVVDQKLADALDGRTIDIEDTADGPRFHII